MRVTKYSVEPKISVASAAQLWGISMQGVHKQLKSKGLSARKHGSKAYLTFTEARSTWNFPFKKMIVASQIVKGGTGKTSSIVNIGSFLNSIGARVLKIDLDPQGNLTDAHGVDAENHGVLIDIIKEKATLDQSLVKICPGMDLIPSRIENVVLDNEIVNQRLRLDKVFENIFSPIVDNYDYILIDCPPTMGQSVAAAALWSNLILSPLNPDKFSAKGLKILKNEIERLNESYEKNIDYRVFLNKYSPKTILSGKAAIALLSDKDLNGRLLKNIINSSQEVPNSLESNSTIFSSLNKSSIREDFRNLAAELFNIKFQRNFEKIKEFEDA